jgi:ribonuclease PH
LRDYSFDVDFLVHPLSSVLTRAGNTRVISSVSLSDTVPSHVVSGGWLTAEYSLLPASTSTRFKRERSGVSGRTAEIQRIIGRSLRMSVDMQAFSGYTMTVDCDVLDADGGTRTTSVNGGMLAVAIACKRMQERGIVEKSPLKSWIGAISGGIIDGEIVIDLDYEHDSRAESDFNFVFAENGRIIEIQGTAEREPLDEKVFLELLAESRSCALQLIKKMKTVAGLE